LRLAASGCVQRQRILLHGRHCVGPAHRDRARQRIERTQSAADREPDQDTQQRNQQGQRKERTQRGLGGDLAALVERMRDLQRMVAVDMRIDAPRVPVLHDVGIAFRDRNGQSGARLRPVDENAVAIPDLGDDLGHARCAPAVARQRRRRTSRNRSSMRVEYASCFNCRSKSSRFRAGFRHTWPAWPHRHGPEAQKEPDEKRPPDRRHARAIT
jgi:hypothetical protein